MGTKVGTTVIATAGISVRLLWSEIYMILGKFRAVWLAFHRGFGRGFTRLSEDGR